MRQSAKRFTSLILSLLLLVGAAVVYFNFISPAYDELQSLRQEQASKAQFVTNEKAAVQKVQSLISTYGGETGAQDTISQALPVGPDISGALLQLSGIAQATGIALQQISVTQTIAPAIAHATQAAGQSVNGITGPFSEMTAPMGTVTFNLQFIGSYESLKTFMQDIETNIRIMDVQQFVIHQSPQTPSSGHVSPDVFSYTMQVNAYYQQPQQTSTISS